VLATKVKGIGSAKLTIVYEEAKAALEGERPNKIYYRKHRNPYESKHGNGWEERIKKPKTMSAYVCVTDMIEHIVVESAKFFVGTKHEDDWVFYHDAHYKMDEAERIF
jgi:hypothetical protein